MMNCEKQIGGTESGGDKKGEKQNDYVLGRNHVSSTRLGFQQWIWNMHEKNLLHSSIPIQPNAALQLADIGTGTGIFLLELAQQLPNAKLDGFDISTDQFPTKEWLPPNVTFSTVDIFKPLPAKLQGKYDIVCISMFTLVITSECKLDTLLQNVVAMLKPGGYLQWSDLNTKSMRPLSPSPSVSCEALSTLAALMVKSVSARKIDMSWPSRLDAVFRTHGLDVTHFKAFECRPELRSAWTSQLLVGFEEFTDDMRRQPGQEARAKSQASAKLLAQAGPEARAGAVILMDMLLCVGRKVA